MRESLRDNQRLQHILDAIAAIQSKPDGYWIQAVNNDPIAYYGLCKLVEIIGEATYKLTHEFRSAHPEVPWETIEGMRHVIVHDYYSISKRMLLQVINKDIEPLRQQIVSILASDMGSAN